MSDPFISYWGVMHTPCETCKHCDTGEDVNTINCTLLNLDLQHDIFITDCDFWEVDIDWMEPPFYLQGAGEGRNPLDYVRTSKLPLRL